MVIEIDKIMATPSTFKHSLKRLKANRVGHKKANLTEFFGALPNISDGLAFQKSVRNEWN